MYVCEYPCILHICIYICLYYISYNYIFIYNPHIYNFVGIYIYIYTHYSHVGGFVHFRPIRRGSAASPGPWTRTPPPPSIVPVTGATGRPRRPRWPWGRCRSGGAQRRDGVDAENIWGKWWKIMKTTNFAGSWGGDYVFFFDFCESGDVGCVKLSWTLVVDFKRKIGF